MHEPRINNKIPFQMEYASQELLIMAQQFFNLPCFLMFDLNNIINEIPKGLTKRCYLPTKCEEKPTNSRTDNLHFVYQKNSAFELFWFFVKCITLKIYIQDISVLSSLYPWFSFKGWGSIK